MVILGGGFLVALLGIGIVWFLAPNVWGSGETLEVPTLEGGTLEQARQMVGEDFEIVGGSDPQAVIQSQEPEPGVRAERGSEISVVLGADKVATVPDVLGRTQEEAEEMLRSEGFEVEVETREGPERLAGNVLEQSPSAGEAEPGAAVRIVVGQAPPPEEEPSPEEPVPEHNAIQDPTGALSVEVPSSWGVETGADSEKDVANAGSWSSVVGYLITSSITAAANLDDWYTADQPHLGAYIVASRELAQTYTDDEILYAGPFASHAETCETGPYEDFSRPPYSGKMQTWLNCGAAVNTIYSVAAAPEGRECVVVLNLSLPSEGASEADREAVQHILDTFELDCAAAVDAP
jgi:beta-lactam-binding protein with PASTA domain